MRLSQLFDKLPVITTLGTADPNIQRICYDTRRLEAGDLFVALQGTTRDGHLLLQDAVQRGATAVVGEKLEYLQEAHALGAVAIQVADSRMTMAKLACAIKEHPAKKLSMVGITGTNGKTTTTYIVEGLLRAQAAQPGVIGTVEYRLGAQRWPSPFTTPEAPELQHLLQEMFSRGASHAVMEVSSHGLALSRVGGIQYHAVAFTNLSQDHLDFHTSMEDYFAAKCRLFGPEYLAPTGRAIINADDEYGAKLLAMHPSALSFSLRKESHADFHPLEAPQCALAGIRTRLATPQGEFLLESPLVGAHNLANLLTALGLVSILGYDIATSIEALRHVQGAPGRLERIAGPRGVDAFVDYAHSPDALARVLEAMRPLTPGRLIAVFGCGGDRDRGKRPKMGHAVAQGADVAVVTSDNPRTESPESILDMIVPGVLEGGMQPFAQGRGYLVEVDRRSAIQKAISLAQPGDAVLIFGKGHEDYQIIGTEKIHFDDREEARSAFGREH